MARCRIRSGRQGGRARQAAARARHLLLAVGAGAALSVAGAVGLWFLPARERSQSGLIAGLGTQTWRVSMEEWGFGRRAYTLLMVGPPPGTPVPARPPAVPARLRAEVEKAVKEIIRADPRVESERLRIPAWALVPEPPDAGASWSALVSGWPLPCLRGVQSPAGERWAVPVGRGAVWPRDFLPLAPWWPGLLADSVLLGLPWLLAPAVGRGVRAGVRRRRNRCPRCGYDLRSSPGRCPECGALNADAGPMDEEQNG